MKSLSQEQILSRLCVHYHDDLRELSDAMLQPAEQITWAGNFSFCKPGTTGLIGYGILTSFRFVWVWFAADGSLFADRSTVKIGDRIGYVKAPTSALKSSEKNSRVVNERPINRIEGVSRQDYKTNDATTNHILEVRISGRMFGQQFIFDEYDNGDELYNHLLETTREHP